MSYDVVVVGGGPAGMMAAGKAALEGAKVALIEKNSELGTKLRVTGAGRCHITNDAQRIQFQHKVLSGGEFLETSLKLFSPRKFLLFLEGLGVPVEYGKDGIVYPQSNNASSLVDALIAWLERLNVKVLCNTESLDIVAPEGVVTGVKIKEGDNESVVKAKAVVIATGGLSHSETGATGDGYRFAESVGHEIEPLIPSLVPLKLGETKKFESLVGLHLPMVRLYAWVNGKKQDDKQGEFVFTPSGISGPVTLDISHAISYAMIHNKKLSLTLDFIPQVDEGDLEKSLVTSFKEQGLEKVVKILKKYVPSRLTPFLVSEAGIDADVTAATVTSKQRKELRRVIKRLELPLISTESIELAEVTAGGVSLKGINEETMESYVCPGLFFAGEVMDLDAQRGGYNLHIAWCTGHLAGENAVRV